MAQTFMVKFKDQYHRRIIIDKDAATKEGLEPGDWIMVTIQKIKPKDEEK